MSDIEKERLKIVDLEECGDLDLINQYVNDCQQITKRIAAASRTVEVCKNNLVYKVNFTRLFNYNLGDQSGRGALQMGTNYLSGY